MQEKLNDLYFSQSALNIFKACPLRFKRKYLDGISWGVHGSDDNVKAKKQELGRLFHLIAERYYSGIPTGIAYMTLDNPLVQWMKILVEVLPIKEENSYYPEYELRLNNGRMKFQAKYDLIIKKANGDYSIYDWKTESKPMTVQKAETSLQTVLYRFLLVQLGEGIFGENIYPNMVEMCYWQPSNPEKPLILKYSDEKYAKDKWLLEKLVDGILAYDFDRINRSYMDKKFCGTCDVGFICAGDRKENGVRVGEYEDTDWRI